MKRLILSMVDGNVEHYNTLLEMSIEDFLIKADDYTKRLKVQVEQLRELEKQN